MSSFSQFATQLANAAANAPLKDVGFYATSITENLSGLTISSERFLNNSEASITQASASGNTSIYFISSNCPVNAIVDVARTLAQFDGILLSVERKVIPESSTLLCQCWVLTCDFTAPDDVFNSDTRSTFDAIAERTAREDASLDIIAVPNPASFSAIQLACFDMDSTLIEIEVIDELARHANIGDKVSKITERAMRGELDFKQSFAARLALLKGLDASVIDHIKASVPITPGAYDLMAGLRARGVTTMIFSGGFDVFAQEVATLLGMHAFHANKLDIQHGKLTGLAHPPVVDAQLKLQLLEHHTNELSIQAANTLAVGDGANDLPMLNAAGLGVAFKAKPIVRQQAQVAINHNDLSSILYLLR